MIPHEKALVQRLEKKPFALLGVNSDGPAEKVAALEKEHGLAWRNAVDGSTDGPIASTWNIRAWPTIFVLDAKGVIRAKGHSLPEGLLDGLIEEAGKP